MMRGPSLCALLASLVVVAVLPVASTIYGDAHPEGHDRREALDRCAARDHGFSRYVAAERAACYQSLLPVLEPVEPPGPKPVANFVDLWQADGRSRLMNHDPVAQAQLAATTTAGHAPPR